MKDFAEGKEGRWEDGETMRTALLLAACGLAFADSDEPFSLIDGSDER
jgi:hypothetical protein